MMIKAKMIPLTSVVTTLVLATTCYAGSVTAPVSGFARDFISGIGISNATITILETGQKITTDNAGNFGPINYPVGSPMTLQLEKWGYKTTQTGTVIVPLGGFTGPYENITFQVPTNISYNLLAYIVGATEDENSCHFVTTITAFHKTLNDLPQGEAGAKLTLFPLVNETPFYFDIFKDGPMKNRTNPFTKGLTETTADGGAAYFNLTPSDVPYRVSAIKNGVAFTVGTFTCRKGAFINMSPPNGPMALN